MIYWQIAQFDSSQTLIWHLHYSHYLGYRSGKEQEVMITHDDTCQVFLF